MRVLRMIIFGRAIKSACSIAISSSFFLASNNVG